MLLFNNSWIVCVNKARNFRTILICLGKETSASAFIFIPTFEEIIEFNNWVRFRNIILKSSMYHVPLMVFWWLKTYSIWRWNELKLLKYYQLFLVDDFIFWSLIAHIQYTVNWLCKMEEEKNTYNVAARARSGLIISVLSLNAFLLTTVDLAWVCIF